MSFNSLIHSPAHSPHFDTDFRENSSDVLLSDIEYIVSTQPGVTDELNRALICSQFLSRHLSLNPSCLKILLNELDIHKDLGKEDFLTLFDQNTADTSFDQQLRHLRNNVMLRVIWRDVNRLTTLEQTCKELSELAELCIQLALDHHSKALKTLYGTPRNNDNEEQGLIVLGMGKLGAHELNLSSDIDLIFSYPDKGHTDGEKSIENHAFFIKLGQKVIQSLDKTTADGFVFRVDMRLRPYGQSGALVSSLSALEEYYQTQGREWERYAMVKARIVGFTGNNTRHSELTALLKNFTYRKYIDFSVIDALRKLKALIQQEVRRRKLNDDVKLGSGGIREIEFIAQVFQLIRGGRDTELQDNRLNVILPLLEQFNFLPAETVKKLSEAYIFLRNSEHAIQAYNDAQTQTLPAEGPARHALITALGFTTWENYLNELDQHRESVRQEFDAVIGQTDNEDENAPETKYESRWQELCEQCDIDKENADYPDLCEFASSSTVQNLSAKGRERLDQFMPLLMAELEHHSAPKIALARILPLIRAIVRRSAYLVLLIENKHALKQLVTLTQTSQQISDQLAKHPALLDELLDTAQLYSLPEKIELENELQRSVLRIEDDDLEQQMDTLRYFKLSHALRIAACEVNGTLPLMKVSDYLTLLAEVILEYSLNLSWRMMVAKHGYPDGVQRDTPEYLVVGYGKLGGIEMNHGSDLDLVFIHNASSNGHTDGKREIDNQTFYVRLGQKLIHIINTQTASGRLFEVDMRLRPSGNSGLLATTLTAFEKYQMKEAWTWEHQALVRARPVAGDKHLASAFRDIRKRILASTRDHTSLAADIVEMRTKMRNHLGSKSTESDIFDLKQDPGGIVDIEFMVQYLVLAWSHAEPSLATYTDNIRILEALAHTDKLSTQEVEQLISMYKALRTVLHRQTIEQKSNKIDSRELQSERDSVIRIWCKLLGTE